MKRWLLVLALTLNSGCLGGPYIPPQVPVEARIPYAADQVVIRLNEFQDFVIDEATAGQIPLPIARQTVSWLIKVRTIIGLTPQGWQAQAIVGWELLKDELARVPRLAPWVPIISALIAGAT